MNEIKRITAMLGDEAIEKRVAAAIVLGELGAGGAAVVSALVAALDGGVPLLSRHALDALARVGAQGALARVLPLVASRDAEVRAAAARAVASVGAEALPAIQARLGEAGPDERRELGALLARLGGKEAFTALLGALHDADAEEAKAAALAARRQIKDADARTRRGYVAQVERFLKPPARKAPLAEGALVAGVKLLGYLEDERALRTLLAHAAADRPLPVRREAVIALRFALGEPVPPAGVLAALLDGVEAADRQLAEAALISLADVVVPPAFAGRLARLAGHEELDRARFAVAQLARQRGPEATRALVHVLATGERRLAEQAAAALAGREEAAPRLADALLEAREPERARLLGRALLPVASLLKAAHRRRLVEAAVGALGAGATGWEAPLEVAREADPKGAAEALRRLVEALARAQPERALAVMRLAFNGEHAGDEERYALASLELRRGRRDEALRLLCALADRGHDVAAAIGRDEALGLEERYQLGFHLVEQGHPLGEELLEAVVAQGGRTKVARMAQNKLKLAARAP